jgi:hypothetical protein
LYLMSTSNKLNFSPSFFWRPAGPSASARRTPASLVRSLRTRSTPPRGRLARGLRYPPQRCRHGGRRQEAVQADVPPRPLGQGPLLCRRRGGLQATPPGVRGRPRLGLLILRRPGVGRALRRRLRRP